MKVKQNKLIFLLILLLIIIIPSNVYAKSLENYTNEKNGYKVVIEDDANLLDYKELQNLKKEMIPLTKYGNIMFKTIDYNPNYETGYYASLLYHKEFGTSSGTIFLIDMDERIIYVFSDGYNFNIITENKALLITDNAYRLAKKGEYYECASKVFSQVHTLLQGKAIVEPMRIITCVLFSITSSFLITYIIVLFSTKIRKARDKELLKNCNVIFNIKDITVKKTGTHRKYCPSSSSSGGGSSSGGSGGGGGGRSSGGGGGHRF